MLIPYFGSWPEWFDLYIESCKCNPSVDWVFFTDCGEPRNQAPNVRFVHTTLEDTQTRIAEKLGITVRLADPYKLCDYKPTFGALYDDYAHNYDFWGFGDVDVIYGNIRRFYGMDIGAYKMCSALAGNVSPHFFLLRNTPTICSIYRKIPNWKRLLSSPHYEAVDDFSLGQLIFRYKRWPPELRAIPKFLSPYTPNLFKRQFHEVLAGRPWLDGTYEYPSEWYWRDGRLTNDKGGGREFLYVHFMRWKSSRYLARHRGDKAAWQTLEKLVHIDATEIRNGFSISRNGFHKLDP